MEKLNGLAMCYYAQKYLSPVFGNVFGSLCHTTLIESVYIIIMIRSNTVDIGFGFDNWIGGTNM